MDPSQEDKTGSIQFPLTKQGQCRPKAPVALALATPPVKDTEVIVHGCGGEVVFNGKAEDVPGLRAEIVVPFGTRFILLHGDVELGAAGGFPAPAAQPLELTMVTEVGRRLTVFRGV